jgi:hypothetical protein
MLSVDVWIAHWAEFADIAKSAAVTSSPEGVDALRLRLERLEARTRAALACGDVDRTAGLLSTLTLFVVGEAVAVAIAIFA